jgi:hypothetical protein
LAVERFRRNVLTGLLTVVPLWITIWVTWFLLDQLVRLGRPFVLALAAAVRPYADDLADVPVQGWFQSALAAVASSRSPGRDAAIPRTPAGEIEWPRLPSAIRRITHASAATGTLLFRDREGAGSISGSTVLTWFVSAR